MSALSPSVAPPAKVITALSVAPESKEALLAWNDRLTQTLIGFSGFLGRESIPPADGDEEWIFVTEFDSPESLQNWKGSSLRASFIEETKTFSTCEGIRELSGKAADLFETEKSVTEVIHQFVKPGQEKAFREWATRIEQAQSRFPGYRGGYNQPPTGGNEGWLTLMRFATLEDLNRWLNSPERLALLEEAKEHIASTSMHSVHNAFSGWAAVSPTTGEAPPNWKTTLLVLLGLYPIVSLEIAYLMRHLSGLPPAVANFIGNTISVFLVAYGTMPMLNKALGWWLYPKGEAPQRTSALGTLFIFLLFGLSILVCGKLL